MRLSIVILTVALATVCNGGQSTNMANDYLISKWKISFQSDDVNNDGIISSADFEKTSGIFRMLHHFDAEKTKEVETKFGKWWNNFYFKGHIREINETQFVKDLNAEFSTNKLQFYNRMARDMNTFYKDFTDTNKDGFISDEEYIILLQEYGEDAASGKRFFQLYKQDPIPLSTVVKSWLSFMTEEDESKESLKSMKNGLEIGLKHQSV